MKVAIHQPEYMPCLSLLAKLRAADVVVLLDDVQFKRDSLQQRCKVAGPSGVRWLSIPFVHQHPQFIRDVRVADPTWPERHRTLLQESYAAAPALDAVMHRLGGFFTIPFDRVASAALCSMAILCEAFDIRPCDAPRVGTRTVLSSMLDAQGHKGDRVLDICKKVGATCYLSGKSGAEYLDHEAFLAAGIEIEVQQFTMPHYREGQPDAPGLSALDAWLYLGDRASEALTNQLRR